MTADTGRRAETRAVAWPEFDFHVPSGVTELAVADAAHGEGPRQERVTALIAALFASVDGTAATPALARSLAAGTREWLVQQGAARFRPDPDWLVARCEACGEAADVPVPLAAMPRADPAADFPVILVETSLGPRRYDLPNGSDEEALARTAEDPKRLLAARCGRADEAALLAPEDLERIDAAMDAAMPEPATEIDFGCPACGAANRAHLDPVAYAFPKPERILGDVHRIASAYGWSESDILRLPIPRRRTYLGLIARHKSA